MVAVAACQAPSAGGAHPDPGAEPTVFVPDMVVPTRLRVTASTRSVVVDRTAEDTAEAEVRLVLDHEADGRRVLALEDPVGTAIVEVGPRAIDVVEDGVRLRLYDADGSGSPDAERTNGDGTPEVRSHVDDAGCTVVTARWTWPPDGPLAATAREETWTLCAPAGLAGRSRTTTFGGGERVVAWSR